MSSNDGIALDAFLTRSENRSTTSPSSSSSSSSYLAYIKSRYGTSNGTNCNTASMILSDAEILEWKQNLDNNNNNDNDNVTNTNAKANAATDDDDDMIILPNTAYCGGGIDSPISVMIDNFIDATINDDDDDNDVSLRYIPSSFTNGTNSNIVNNTTIITTDDNLPLPSPLSLSSSSSSSLSILKLPLDGILGTRLNTNTNTIRTEADVFIHCYINQLTNNDNDNDDSYNDNVEDINDDDNNDNNDDNSNDINIDNNNDDDYIMPRRFYEALHYNSNSSTNNDNEGITLVEEIDSNFYQ